MKNYTITEEQIKEVYNGGGLILKKWFPEVFEIKLEVGKWYKHKNYTESGLICIEKYNGENEGLTAYGFYWNNEGWSKSHSRWCINSKHELIEATEEEVFEALKNEAVKRGFKEGVYFIEGENVYMACDKKRHCKGEIQFYGTEMNALCFSKSSSLIFKEGVWAEIVPTLTKEEAEKKLNVKIID